ncbi:MAG: ABC transporter permease subunit [Hoeflea sp.]|uniref:ABC transporter permease n=1 Tax=Hoeflea sp. TaxID=1940281 RepID=UPI002731868B|nr:ABC transporter permease subunit [Hoeflea sp.]MDP2122119.1 ABC transporter permease subunit [Hoeflea sp.]MDZ7601769.1 ABC transporter permease subunit [Hoeflea sp.]
MHGVLTIAATEIRIGLRNRWIILSSLILLAFALILVLLGSAPGGEVKTDAVTVVVASLSTLSVYLVPLIALLLAFDAIAGEIDRGTLQLVLASPVSRGAVLVGKFLGHVTVLGIAVSFGYGIAGLVAFFATGGGDLSALVGVGRLIVTSIILGATFIAIGYIASASVRQTGTAAALAIAIWLFAVVLYDLALLGGLLASQDGVFARDIFPWLLVLNPADAFRLYNMSAIDAAAVGSNLGGGAGAALPLSGLATMLSPIAWAILALGLSTLILKRIRP